MKRLLVPLVIASTFVGLSTAGAAPIDNIAGLTQKDFRLLSEDLSSGLSYKAVSPVESLGITGFDIGVEATETKLANAAALDAAMTTGNAPDTLVVPKIHIQKGLPLGIDVGAFYASVPSTDIKLSGAEIRYALVDGGIAEPAIGLRGTYTKLTGVDNLDFSTKGLELGISKGFAVFTPYAGVGHVWTTSTPIGAAKTAGLKKEDISQNKTFVGFNLNLAVINIDVEADKTGEATSYGLKLGWRF